MSTARTKDPRQWMPIDEWFVAVGAAEMTDRYRDEARYRALKQMMRSKPTASRSERDGNGRPAPGVRTNHANQCQVDGGTGLPPGACPKCSVSASARAQYESLLERIDRRAR